MRALVTRPRREAEALAQRLREKGLEVTIEPMLEIVELRRSKPLDFSGVQACLVTSASGARALAEAGCAREVPVYAVGEASADAAREAGFASVDCAGGDSAALVRRAAERLDPAAGALLHASGVEVSGDLAGALRARGFKVRREVLYRARAAKALSPGLRSALEDGAIDLALFFSPRSAATFVELIDEAGLAAACAPIEAFFLSPAVAEAGGALDWQRAWTASRPDQEALVELVDRALEARAQ